MRSPIVSIVLAAAFAGAIASAGGEAVMKELGTNGKLRVGIAVSPAPSASFAAATAAANPSVRRSKSSASPGT
jgi:hypothetical protein